MLHPVGVFVFVFGDVGVVTGAVIGAVTVGVTVDVAGAILAVGLEHAGTLGSVPFLNIHGASTPAPDHRPICAVEAAASAAANCERKV